MHVHGVKFGVSSLSLGRKVLTQSRSREDGKLARVKARVSLHEIIC